MLFGGTIAALAAEQMDASGLVLVEPVVRGRQYARELLRREAVARLMGEEAEEEGDGLKSELAANGRVTIRGLQLTQEAYEALAAVDLTTALVGFAGSSLLVGISPSGEPGRRSGKLRDRLVELGGDVTVTGIADPLYAPGRVLLPRGGPAETGHPARARSEGRRRRRRLGARPCGSVRPRMREFPVFVAAGADRVAAVVTAPEEQPPRGGSSSSLSGTGRHIAIGSTLSARLSERLAEEGFASARLDYGGRATARASSRSGTPRRSRRPPPRRARFSTSPARPST